VASDLSSQVRRQAAAHPDTVALSAGGLTCRYAELVGRADRMAAGLREHGMRTGDVVALPTTRSIDTLTLMLAVVFGGGACMPLDLSYPAARLAAMLEDAKPSLCVAPDTLALPAASGVRRCTPEDLTVAVVTDAPAMPGPLAYVLFTSGSTGRPKGVAMRGAVLADLVAWHVVHPRLGQPARTLQFAPLGFDVAFQEMFSSWATGSCLVLPTDTERRDPQALLALLASARIERLFLPYVALQALAEAFVAGGEAPTCLRDVITAGEALRITPAIRALFAALPGAVLHNHYGPTETHVVTAFELAGDPACWPDLPPIGRPLPYVRVRLVDADLSDTPAGTEGELLLGGDCLAAGYIHQPERTAERFIELGGERWYRTGDLARDAGDGTLAYLGRLDSQIKLDGYRIEPGEIEAVLSRHPGVAEAVVVAVDQRLVAHVVPRDVHVDDAVLTDELLERCRANLASYLMPHAIRVLPGLPLTASGKIDRRQLARDAAAPGLTWPENVPLEGQLLGLWRQVLGAPTLAAADNVFVAGARSLMVVRVLTELRKHGHRRLSVADIYEYPSVAGQLRALAAEGDDVSPAAARERGERQRSAFGRFAPRPGGHS
jgi:amino acid adenylation domain-containing protein